MIPSDPRTGPVRLAAGREELTVPPALVDRVRTREADAGLSGGMNAGLDGGMNGEAWLRSLPSVVDAALRRWELRVDPGRPVWTGRWAVVVPVWRGASRGTGGADRAVLKVTWPHAAAAQEHLALRAWSGRPAARLLAADPASWTLLLEPLDTARDLAAEPSETACAVLGGLLAGLAIPAPGWARTLSSHLTPLTERLTGPGKTALPRRFLDQARSLIGELSTDPATDATLLHAELDAGSVLAVPESGGWVALDPVPLAADPAYGVWPALRDVGRNPEAGDGYDDPGAIRWDVHCRLGWVCDAAGVDEDRARGWAIVRTVADALARHDRNPGVDLTRSVTLLKALQPW